MARQTLGRDARKKGSHSAEQMQKGIDLHISGKSLRQAAKEANVAYPTLRRYVQKYLQNPQTNLESNYSVQKIFTAEQELSLKDYILDCSDKFYGLSIKQCCQLAYEMAVTNNIKTPPTWDKNKMAGRDWLRGFRKRHPNLSLRKPEPCSLARATAFNKDNVQKFYKNLRDVYSRHPEFANGNRVYNLDETATTTVQRPQKVLARKGHSVSKITSGERGVLVTTCCIVNALGQALPPALIFPRKKYKPHMLHGAPPGSLGLANPSGWMNGQLFVDVMKHFIKYSCASKDNPALLIMDNHESHLSIEAIELAKSSGITILTLHPHTTARMQPLDVGLNGPFKVFYNAAVDSWLVSNPGKMLTIYEIARCVGQAYLKAMTPQNIVSAFKKCGIIPYNDSIFTEIDFLPANVTDRLIIDVPDQRVTDEECEKHSECGSPSVIDNFTAASSIPKADELINSAERPDRPEELVFPSSISPQIHSNRMVSPLLLNSQISTYAVTPPKKRRISVDKPNTTQQPIQTKNTSSASPKISVVQNTEIEPSTSKQFVSPAMFRPPIKAGPRKNTRRQTGRSLIATDTPEKIALSEKKQIKNTKKSKEKVIKLKQQLFKNNKNKKLPNLSPSSDDDDDVFICSGSSSGGEQFISDLEEEEIVLTNQFPPLHRTPRPRDYVIVQFKSKNDIVYYIAQIIEFIKEDGCDYFVTYLKLKSKALQQFVEPLEPDTAAVSKRDVKFILPIPKIKGSSRRQEVITFPVDMSRLNLRY